MRRSTVITLFMLALLTAGCSLPPEKMVYKEELFRTGIYRYYQIKEPPENVLAALNRDGEVVVEATYKKIPVYLKIMTTMNGLKIYEYDR